MIDNSEESKSKSMVKSHRDLRIYQIAFETAMQIFELSKKFPVEERYSLTDQIRSSSRSVCANMAEAWRKRRYESAFVAKLNDCVRVASPKELSEAAETQTWIEFTVKCNYLDIETGRNFYANYNQVLSGLVTMINNPSRWLMNHKNHK
jgi:four helix bundle protein